MVQQLGTGCKQAHEGELDKLAKGSGAEAANSWHLCWGLGRQRHLREPKGSVTQRPCRAIAKDRNGSGPAAFLLPSLSLHHVFAGLLPSQK